MRRKRKQRKLSALLPYLSVVIAFYLFIHFGAGLAMIHGPSMEPTLEDGDIVVVWKYRYEPSVGDIVITDRDNLFQVCLVKRVMALGEEYFQIIGNNAIKNGSSLNTPPPRIEDANIEEKITCLIPAGHVFLMGDNVQHSIDSRTIGSIPQNHIVGKVVFRIFPLSRFCRF